MPITVKQLDSLSRRPGKWLSERVRHGHGSLAFRALAGGEIAIYFRYQDGEHRRLIHFGMYGADGARGKVTLTEARTRAGELAQRHGDGITALREFLEAEARKQTEALRMAKEGTFDELLNAYCDVLKAAQKESATQVAALFQKWVRIPFPHLLTMKAGAITQHDVMTILENVAKTEKIRTVNKLRSYLLAAFNRAIKANGNPYEAIRMGRANAKYGIVNNPVASTVRVSGFDRTNVGNKLDPEQIRWIWAALESQPLEVRNFFRLNLRLGGQRVIQLLRLKGNEVDLVKGKLVLWDRKGRRQKPRKHSIPIPQQAFPLLAELISCHGDGYLFSRDGTKPLNASLISITAKKISDDQTALNPNAVGFTPRDFRTTGESRLAELRVAEETRGRLLSHGLGGLQDTHYDQADYSPLLKEALLIWNRWLDSVLDGGTPIANNVVPFPIRNAG